MSGFHRGFTNDPLYKNLNMDFEDNVNFFSGEKVEVTKKDETENENDKKEKDTETPSEEEIEGLENLVKSFSFKVENVVNTDPIVEGNEGIISFGKSLAISLWELIKDIGIWIKSLFTNKMARIETKVQYTAQRRKLKGIKDGEEVRYPSSVMMLVIPTKVSMDPDWTYECAEVGIAFYTKVMDVVKDLKHWITKEIEDKDEAKLQVMQSIAKSLTGQSLKEGEQVTTDIIPGNRVYNVRSPIADNANAALTFFSESNTTGKPKTEKFTVTGPLIDNALKVLVNYQQAIERNQKNTSELQRTFESEVNRLINNEKITSDRKQFLAWLSNTHKRLVNTTLQQAVQTINALDDFINAGLKS